MTTEVFGDSPPADVGSRQAIVPAPIGKRAIARLLDFGLGVLIFAVMVWLVGVAAGTSPDGTGIVLASIFGTFVTYLVFEVVLVAAWGRTLGKHVMGLESVRADGGGRPGVGRSFLRNLIPTLLLVGLFPLYPLSYVLAAIAKDHRWPNDRLAGTVVRSR